MFIPQNPGQAGLSARFAQRRSLAGTWVLEVSLVTLTLNA